MENMNFNDFLATLAEEQRAAILACRTEEELEQVIDDYDIEIPDEMLVGVAGGKGEFLAAALASLVLLATAGCSSVPRKLAPAETERYTMPPAAAATAVAETTETPESPRETTAVETAVDAAVSTQPTTAAAETATPASTAPAATTAKPATTTTTTAATTTTSSTTTATATTTATTVNPDQGFEKFLAAQKEAERNAMEYTGVGYSVVSAELIPGDGKGYEFKIGVAPNTDRSLITYLCVAGQYCVTEGEWLGHGFSGTAQYFADKRATESNVRSHIGASNEIITCESLPNNDNANYFKVGVARRGTNGPITYYYAGKDFFKTEQEWLAPPAPVLEEDGQNPIMNFIGNYSNGRGTMTVSAQGTDTANIAVSWSSSAFDTAEWKMSGTMTQDGDKLIVKYQNCSKVVYSYTADGTLNQMVTMYEGGSGTIIFSGDQAEWIDNQEEIANGQVFRWC